MVLGVDNIFIQTRIGEKLSVAQTGFVRMLSIILLSFITIIFTVTITEKPNYNI
jgi:hypothetical protein